MIDGKMVTNLLNCGGAYCTMCTKSQDECHKLEVIKDGFIIERSVESMRELALALVDKEVQNKRDRAVRQGICGEANTEADLTKNIPVCHSKISFEQSVDLIIRSCSHQIWWTPTNGQKYSPEYDELYLQQGSDKLNASRSFFVSLVSDQCRGLDLILLGLTAIFKVINSKRRNVNTSKVCDLGQPI